MESTGYGPSIFLSYKRSETQELVQQIHSYFRNTHRRTDIRFDKAVLAPGRRWWDQLIAEIKNADVFGFVISKSSARDFIAAVGGTMFCVKEFEVAQACRKKIVPIVWERPEEYGLLPDALQVAEHISFERFRLSGMRDTEAFNASCDSLRAARDDAVKAWLNEAAEWYGRLKSYRSTRSDKYLLEREEVEKIVEWDRQRPRSVPLASDHPTLLDFLAESRRRLGLIVNKATTKPKGKTYQIDQYSSIFLSYSMVDDDAHRLVRKIYDKCEDEFKGRYLQIGAAAPGDDWELIAKVIERVDAYGFVISAGTSIDFALAEIAPSPCIRQLGYALSIGKTVIPVLWEMPESPDFIPEVIQQNEWVSFEDYRKSGMQDDNSFIGGLMRLRDATFSPASEWLDEKMEWYDRLTIWREMGRNGHYLLDEDGIEQYEELQQRRPIHVPMPPEHPSMTEFIALSRQKPRG